MTGLYEFCAKCGAHIHKLQELQIDCGDNNLCPMICGQRRINKMKLIESVLNSEQNEIAVIIF